MEDAGNCAEYMLLGDFQVSAARSEDFIVILEVEDRSGFIHKALSGEQPLFSAMWLEFSDV